jgi:hypothetical protein
MASLWSALAGQKLKLTTEAQRHREEAKKLFEKVHESPAGATI